MDKIKDYIYKYKLIVPTITFLIIALVIMFFLKVYNYNVYRDKSTIVGYKMVLSQKVDFDLTIYKNKLGIIKEVQEKNDNLTYDSNPFYYNKEDKVLFLDKMAIIFPFDNYNSYKIDKYFNYIYKDKINYLEYDGSKYEYYNYFLYDGSDLYFFIDDITLFVNDTKYDLKKMSYVSLIGTTLIYYDYNGDSNLIELKGKEEVIVKNEYINIDIKNDMAGKRMLPNDVTSLPSIKEVKYVSKA